MGDTLKSTVHDHCQLVAEQTIGATDHKIADIPLHILFDLAT